MFSKKEEEEEEEGEKEKKKKKKQKERRKKKWRGSGGDTRHISMATHRLDHLQARNRTQQQASHARKHRAYAVLVPCTCQTQHPILHQSKAAFCPAVSNLSSRAPTSSVACTLRQPPSQTRLQTLQTSNRPAACWKNAALVQLLMQQQPRRQHH